MDITRTCYSDVTLNRFETPVLYMYMKLVFTGLYAICVTFAQVRGYYVYLSHMF